MRTWAGARTIGVMRLQPRRGGSRKNGRGARRVGGEMSQTLSVASQMALLFPSGMDVWMQRELSGCFELPRHGAAPRR